MFLNKGWCRSFGSAGSLPAYLTRRDAIFGAAALLGIFNLHVPAFAKSSVILVSELIARARQEHSVSTSLAEFYIRERARLTGVCVPQIIWTSSADDALEMAAAQLQPLEGIHAGNFWETDAHIDVEPLRASLAIEVLDHMIQVCRDEADDFALMRAETRLQARLLQKCTSARDFRQMRNFLQHMHASQKSLAIRVSIELSRIMLMSDEDSHGQRTTVRRALATFGAWENGLSATWEAPDAIVCLARGHGRRCNS